jgi:hypothetical protein
MRRIGFWKESFLDDLPNPHLLVDANWSPAERLIVIAYLRSGSVRDRFFGFSWCRFECGIPEQEMGNRELTDGVYVWPEGYVHYIERHGVKPPTDFIERALLLRHGGRCS